MVAKGKGKVVERVVKARAVVKVKVAKEKEGKEERREEPRW